MQMDFQMLHLPCTSLADCYPFHQLLQAEVNLRAKSLKTYLEKFSPEVSIRTSMADYKKEEWLINLPLYAINQIKAEFEV